MMNDYTFYSSEDGVCVYGKVQLLISGLRSKIDFEARVSVLCKLVVRTPDLPRWSIFADGKKKQTKQAHIEHRRILTLLPS